MENTTLDQGLKVLDSLNTALAGLNLPSLGEDFKVLKGNELHEALVRHRLVNKYEIPDASAAKLRKQYSIDEVLTHDRNGLSEFDYSALPFDVRKDFLHARNWLGDLFKGFEHNYRLRFPTGEGFISMRGKTDLFFKLRDQTQWEVSPDLVDYIVNILMRHRGLLSVVKQRYREKYGQRGREILESLRLKHILAYPNGSVHKLRKCMIHFMFRAVVRLNRASRVTTVPKDNKRDRVITCECLWTMVAQLSFAASLRDHVKKRLGIDLTVLQDVHRALIRSGAATIDLSKASDSNYMCVLRQLWPGRMYSFLEKIRTGLFEVDGEFHPLRMFAPMGCGCTFEVMTITLLAHARVLDRGASVFGDDIIVAQPMAERLITNLTAQGWIINESKSFTDGNFRESCGAFADLTTNELLLSYDLRRPENLPELYLAGHKLLQLGHSLKRGRVREMISTAYAELCLVMPRDSLGVIDEVSVRPTAGLQDGVFYVPLCIYRNRAHRRESSVTRVLSTLWQRPVGVTNYHTTTASTLNKRPLADRTLYACYMSRGASYAIPTGTTKTYQLQVDSFAGIALRDVRLFTVLTAPAA